MSNTMDAGDDENMNKDIDTIRAQIDALDDELLELLRKRFELCVEMGALKGRTNRDAFDPSREEAIVQRLTARLSPPLTAAMVEKIFMEIFSISRSLQQRRKVAYLGPEGSYSHQAAHVLFSHDALLVPQKDIDAVISEVLMRRADLGVVPVENSTEGMVNRTLDLMATSRLYVNREVTLPIRNCLLSTTTLDKVRIVYSHPQALAQCRNWLTNNLPGAEVRETPSTSDAALAARDQEHAAAVASSLAARLYGLNILAENISDFQENITRFWVVSPAMTPVEGKAKTSIILTLENIPGALYHAIGVFAQQGVNLTKIESRPSRKDPWEYIFFIDFQGSLKDNNVEKAMEELRRYTRDVTVLGSYPEGRTIQ
ncbi:MAG: prephenate dehydratase [Desulfomonilia bacterium]|jgi:chorismate mutase/prephenate dehydratase|uniref:Bifunctional chorismate mutase/prephenate dehydratase n=1 Tax=anaerobic digester metagenome TaxID=1263854 RepID=A0A485LWD9_9ZZZZ|nr:prephenate dehydratase [Deltaproteobacteria bacterium]HPD22260.1 prephenate dehydratase [Deltaproteobacteria bacterium]HPX19684.1 prephenate dehydratase [Deltaproteobacteria bacterium]HRV35717.1 prephenate dehydratase [Desulfomonilia bacterium]